jgi:hypothetical protein
MKSASLRSDQLYIYASMTDGVAKQYQISSHKEGYANQPVGCSRMQKKLFYYYYFYRGPYKTSLTVNEAKTTHFVRGKYCQEVHTI